MMTTRFGTGWLVDGSHLRIKIGPHRDFREEVNNNNKFEQKKQRGFKRGSGRTSHHASMAGLEDRGAQDQGWPQRGSGVFSSVPAWWAEGEERGVSQDPPSSSSPTFKGGRRGFRGATSAKKVVFAESAASPSSSPRRGECEQARPARVNAVYKGQEDSLQEEHWDSLNDREVTVITPAPPAPPAPPGPYSPLMEFQPPCVSRLLRGGTQQWNPKAPAWQPRDPDVRPWACGQLQLPGQLPAATVWASTTWVEGPEFLGIGPLPMPGSGSVIPLYRPSPEPANLGWQPVNYTGAGGPSCC